MSLELLKKCQRDFGPDAPSPPPGARAKIQDRRDDFDAAGWTADDLFQRAPQPYGHHGLVWWLHASVHIDEISEWWCTLYRPAAMSQARQTYTREAPLPTLVAKYGRRVLVGRKLGFNVRLFTEADLKGGY